MTADLGCPYSALRAPWRVVVGQMIRRSTEGMIQALATRYRALATWDIGSLVTYSESWPAAAQRSGGRGPSNECYH